MAALGRAVRDRSRARVVAVTGSTGKTSTKDILAALCRPHLRTVAAEQSHNNEIGLPLTLTRIEPDTEIVDRGDGDARARPGARSCAASPGRRSRVITQIGPAHLELFGTVERSPRRRPRSSPSSRAGGVVCVPAGERLLDPHLRREDVEVVTYGDGGDVELLGFEPGEDDARLDVSVRRRADRA